MTDYIACGQVVPERIAAIVKGIARGLRARRLRAGRRRDRRAPGAAGAGRVRRRGRRHGCRRGRPAARGRTGSAPATSWSRWRRAGCTPTATRWCATCCSTRAGWSLDRHVAELGRTLGRGAARADPDLRPRLPGADRARSSVHALRHVTGGGLAANLARVLPAGLSAAVDRATWSPPPIFGAGRRASARWRRDELERTLNMGVGMVAVVAADDADARGAAARRPRRAGLGLRRRHRRGTVSASRLTRALHLRGRRSDDIAPADERRGRHDHGPRQARRSSPSPPSRPSVVVLVLVGSLVDVVGALDRSRLRAPAAAPRSRCPASCTSARGRPWSAWPWPGRAPWLDPLIRNGAASAWRPRISCLLRGRQRYMPAGCSGTRPRPALDAR